MTETRTDPTSQIRFLKITATVEIKAEQGKWIARSKSLDLEAAGDSPEDAMKVLEEYVNKGERSVSNPNVRQYVSKKRDKKVEEEVADESDPFAISFTADDVAEATKPELEAFCKEVGITYSGKNKTDLQDDLITFLTKDDVKDIG